MESTGLTHSQPAPPRPRNPNQGIRGLLVCPRGPASHRELPGHQPVTGGTDEKTRSQSQGGDRNERELPRCIHRGGYVTGPALSVLLTRALLRRVAGGRRVREVALPDLPVEGRVPRGCAGAVGALGRLGWGRSEEHTS